MVLQELYTAVGGDYNDALKRMMNERLIDRFVLKFLADPTMEMLTAAVEAGNIEDSFRAVHTLKGVAANLAFTKLAVAAHELTEQLRGCTEQADRKLYEDVLAAYELTAESIKAYQAQKN